MKNKWMGHHSRNEGEQADHRWWVAFLGLVFWSAVVLVPLAFVAGFAIRAWR